MLRKIEFYAFSGTGNTYAIADAIADHARRAGVEASVAPLDYTVHAESYVPSADVLLGIFSSTLGFIQAPAFFSFIVKLPKSSGTPVVLGAVGSYTKIGPLIVNGYVGCGLYIAALILALKGYRVVGVDGFGMPQNWSSVVPAYSVRTSEKIVGQVDAMTSAFAAALLAEKPRFKKLFDAITGVLLLPVSAVFVFFAHVLFVKAMFPSDRCTGCGMCAKSCPVQAIAMKGKKHPRPYWTRSCEQCMRCVGYCPQRAVDTNLLWIAAAGCASVPVAHDLTALLAVKMGFVSGMLLSGVELAIGMAVMLLFSLAFYRVFWLLNRIPFVNMLFSVTSLSYYWKKYRSPSVKLSKFRPRVE